MKRIGNVAVKEFERFLAANGYVHSRTNGGHRIWTKAGTRSIVLQSHIDPVPVSVIKCNLISMGKDTGQLLKYLEGKGKHSANLRQEENVQENNIDNQ